MGHSPRPRRHKASHDDDHLRMSHARKHVLQEARESRPEPTDDQSIVQVVAAQGGYLFQVQTSDGKKFLGRMPSRFRDLLWIKNGFFLIADTPPELLDANSEMPEADTERLQGEILHVLYDDQIRHLKKLDLWPDFGASGERSGSPPAPEFYYEEDEGIASLNPNHA